MVIIMNSKEALDEMFDLLNYEQTGICGDKNLYRIIAKDLERLEKLEKFVDIYKYTNQRFIMMVQAPYSDLPSPTMEQELLRVEVLNND